MSLRLLKILVPEEQRSLVLDILDEYDVGPRWCSSPAAGRVVVDAILPGSGNEPVLDALEERLAGNDGTRLTLLPVEATIPRLEEREEPGEAEAEAGGTDQNGRRIPDRINREELYADIAGPATASRYYLVMVGLSAVVASAGLMMGDTAVIIGAMVIAPLLGPNMALAFATTLGDLDLGRSALVSTAAGVAVAFGVAVLIGFFLAVDPSGPEIAPRTEPGFGHLALALAAGAAGALALTRGLSEGLVGVMVAVALLPPLAAAGLLIGAGEFIPGAGALLLVAANVACVNLAAIGSFLIQGIRPLTWWDEKRAKRATWIAAGLWAGLVAGLTAIIWWTLGA